MSHRLLVVDDDELVHMTIDLLFEGAPYTIEHAKSGVEAIHMVKNGPKYDVVIMDYNMPEMTGAEVSRSLLSISNDLKIIINSGEVPTSIQNECLDAGVIGFVNKNAASMIDKVRELCK